MIMCRECLQQAADHAGLRFVSTLQAAKPAEASADAEYIASPRRAHDTLQPQDESIIVGYYTSAVLPKAAPSCNSKSGGKLPMARGDGIHRTSARNARMKDTDIDNAQAHNEREKSSYVNQTSFLNGRHTTSISKRQPPGIRRCSSRCALTA